MLFTPLTPCPIKTRQRYVRIRVAICAYAYEFLNSPIIPDAEYDKLVLEIDPSVSTIDYWHDAATVDRYLKLDKFFRDEFSCHTGQWIYKHPELTRVANCAIRESYNKEIRK